MDLQTQRLMEGAAGAGSDPIGVEDLFKTYVYTGNATYPRTITNGIDFSGEGGLLIQKSRSNGYGWIVYDTERGAGAKALRLDGQGAENSGEVGQYALVDQFNSNGFRLNQPSSTDVINGNNLETVSYSFRKQKYFFDIVKFTFNSSSAATSTAVPHNLGVKPGMVIYRRYDGTGGSWMTWHNKLASDTAYYVVLNSDSVQDINGAFFGTAHTSTTFCTSNSSTYDGDEFVAYLFAGAESSAATAVSVDFDGNDSLSIDTHSDFNYGTGDFTWEFWAKLDSTSGTQYFMDHSTSNNGGTFHMHGGLLRYLNPTTGTGSDLYNCGSLTAGRWHHIAASRSSGTTKVFVDGELRASATDSHNYPDGKLWIARRSDGQQMTGSISNFRIVNGTALYTAAFTPPTEPLTNITNTKILCCNNASVTGSTVIPSGSSLYHVGNATANSDSPFLIPDEAVFGPNGDQHIIRTGFYKGGGSSDVDVYVGFEPSFLLVKKISDSGGWVVFDSIRGIVTNGNDAELIANTADAESSGEKFNLTPTGFKTTTNSSYTNSSGHTYIYLAIAAETGKTSKVPENGTDVFGMDHGNGSSTNIPNFDSTFPVDLALNKVNQTTGTGAWYLSTRISEGIVRTDTDAQASSGSWALFDSNVGWCLSNSYGASSSFSHMWKRYSGLDCLHHTGTGSAGTISHNLGADNVPEMIWIKRRDFWQGQNWVVGHKGLNGGTNPWNYYLVLNETNAEAAQSAFFNDTAPTSSVFSLGSSGAVNTSGSPYTIILFSSVEGISHVGSYDGSSSSQTITTGFQPRFVIIKCTTHSEFWAVLDTTRGWGSGADNYLELDSSGSQSSHDFGAPTSTGFTLTVADSYNNSGRKYIYYAHA